MSLRELVFWGWWNVYLWTPLCYFVAIFHLFSQSLSIVLRCGGRLMNITFSFLSAMCIRLPGFALIRVSCRCVIEVMLLSWVCCRRLIWTLITVFSVSFHLLLLEFEVSRCRTFQFARCFLRAQVRIWNDLPYTVFDTDTLDGFKAVNRWLLHWIVFSSVFCGVACVVCETNISTIFFTTWPCAEGINNNNNNNNNNNQITNSYLAHLCGSLTWKVNWAVAVCL